jgi:hypothetical protein
LKWLLGPNFLIICQTESSLISACSVLNGEVHELLEQSAECATCLIVVKVGEVTALNVSEGREVSHQLGEVSDGGGNDSGEGLGDVAGVEVGELGCLVEELTQGALPKRK